MADEILPELSQPDAQTYLLKVLLPQIRDHMAEGLVGDIRSARVERSGVIVRNLDTNTEMLRPDVTNLPDVQSYLAEISAQIRQVPTLNPQSRRAINILLSAIMCSSAASAPAVTCAADNRRRLARFWASATPRASCP